jgi:hypothetical protein
MRHAYFRPLLMVALLWGAAFTGFAWRVSNPPVRWQTVHAEQPPPVRSTALAAAAPREAAPHRLAVLLEQATLRLVQQPAPPAPQVRLPATPPAPQPPQPVPGTPTKLGANQWYIIDSDLALVVLTSPPGLVGVGSEAGPIKLRGWFVDAAGVETRTYKGKFIYCLDAAGVGKCELLIIRSDNQEVIRRWLDVDNGGPAPKPPEPPGPKPDPGPGPTPTPGPIPRAGLHVLIVYDAAKENALPKEQQAILFDKDVRDYLNTKCVADPDFKRPAWNIWQSTVSTASVPKIWQDAFARPRASLPWVLISSSAGGFEGPLPATKADMKALVEKYAK